METVAVGGEEPADAARRAGGAARPTHRRLPEDQSQLLWIAFGGQADQTWLRPLRPGFRHCFAALRDAEGWTVLDPLSGRLLVARLPVPVGFDLPGFYRRAGMAVLGPYRPGQARPRRLPPLLPFSCVSLCRSLLGAEAPFAVTPWGLFRALNKIAGDRKKILTGGFVPG
nr:hypothetical protein [Roseomonas acroporae]